MSADFDMGEYIARQFDEELRNDLRFESGLAIRCAVSILVVVLLVIARQLYFV